MAKKKKKLEIKLTTPEEYATQLKLETMNELFKQAYSDHIEKTLLKGLNSYLFYTTPKYVFKGVEYETEEAMKEAKKLNRRKNKFNKDLKDFLK